MQWFHFYHSQLFKCYTFIFAIEKPTVPRVNAGELVKVGMGTGRQRGGLGLRPESKSVLFAHGAWIPRM